MQKLIVFLQFNLLPDSCSYAVTTGKIIM